MRIDTTIQYSLTHNAVIMVGHDVVEKPPFFMHHGKDPKVIHVNFTSARLDPVYFPDLDVVGDIGNAIWQMKESLKEPQAHWKFSNLMKIRNQLLSDIAEVSKDSSFPMHPARVVTDVRSVMPEHGIVSITFLYVT